jgi:ABC-type Na+ transport system ATPase subunit NatA
MTSKEILLDCLEFYQIPVLAIDADKIGVFKNYTIEVENNGLYKLLSGNEVIAPFADLNDLCNFILNY